MHNESQSSANFDPNAGLTTVPSQSPASPANKPIAPLWHTALIVSILLIFSFLGSNPNGVVMRGGSRILLYGGTAFFELVLFGLIWIWIRRSGVSMRDLIGGRWDSVESFLLDVAIAVAFFVCASVLLAGVRVVLGTLDLHHTDKQLADTKRMLGPLIPHTPLEAFAFVGLSVAAGLFEEIIFRGYLQRQFTALARNAWVGIVASAVIFGLGHGYQGSRMMVVIGIYGAFFGILAHFRKSLRPGMMAHASQDALAGLILFFFSR
jgi:membrane protease YdiL (CAAX protease family)